MCLAVFLFVLLFATYWTICTTSSTLVFRIDAQTSLWRFLVQLHSQSRGCHWELKSTVLLPSKLSTFLLELPYYPLLPCGRKDQDCKFPVGQFKSTATESTKWPLSFLPSLFLKCETLPSYFPVDWTIRNLCLLTRTERNTDTLFQRIKVSPRLLRM